MAEINVVDGPPQASGSGLKLVLPSLKSVQALKGVKRKKSIGFQQDEPKPKIPRPVKLKPLKEVLTKLITQIKKKDDYAFFLKPVDVANVPGYADVIKHPMDLGTMTTKVEKGKYRSLEEFADDMRLVTTNAKTFNPPGSIYYNEAERIESWALEHITKAAGTVIEYETDWNIDVERDYDPEDGEKGEGRLGEGEKGRGTPMDGDDAGSIASAQTPVSAHPSKRKAGEKGKKPPGALSESLEADGGLPGTKDGLGAFPPGSDWAELMLALKLKGKRYRTKKERLRMERGGPPYRADGSLDYAELEEPFSVLQFFVPDPPSRPLLTPLYPPAPAAEQSTQPSQQPSTSAQPPFPTPVVLPTSPADPGPSIETVKDASSSHSKKRKRRHWTIVRNTSSRRAKEREEEEEEEPAWKAPRVPSASDFGPFAALQHLLASEGAAADVSDLGSERRLFEAIRASVENSTWSKVGGEGRDGVGDEDEAYWREKGNEAQEYIRDVVYGGVDGYAYARSLAEFVAPSTPLEDADPLDPPFHPALGVPLAHYVSQHILDPLTGGLHGVLASAFSALRDAEHLAHAPAAVRAQIPLSLSVRPVAERTLAALTARLDMTPLIRAPEELYQVEGLWAGHALREERRRRKEEEEEARGDAAAFLKFAIEQHQEAQAQVAASAPAGGAAPKVSVPDEDPEVLQHVLGIVADTIEGMIREKAGVKDEAEQKDEEDGVHAVADATGIVQATVDGGTDLNEEESPADPQGEIQGPALHSTSAPEPGLGSSAATLTYPSSRPTLPDAPAQEAPSALPPVPQASLPAEHEAPDCDRQDPAMHALRMNLLGLAKRAPLQTIAPLPAALVPEQLRGVVPLLPS